MTHRGLVCLLLLGTAAWGQAAKPTASTTAPAAQASEASEDKEAKAPDPSKVAPDAAVITIPGLCNAPASQGASGDCKTVITKQQFEDLVQALAPNMPVPARRQLASRYASGLMMAHQAEEMGLDKGPHYDEMMKISRIQVLAQELQRSMQEKADQIPDKDIEDYYKANQSQFEEADLHRLFVPRNKQMDPPKEKLSDEAMKKRQEDAEASMKALATRLQARAAAGEDFDKLQAEAFAGAGLKAKAPNTAMGKIRRTALPPAHGSAFDLKTGQVSPLISDGSGFFVYKMGEKGALPVDKAKEEIHNILRGQRLQESMEAMQKSVNPTLNDDYFGPEGPARPGFMGGGTKSPHPVAGKAPAATQSTEPK